MIWSRLQAELANWKGLFASLASLQDQFSEIAGGDPASMTVNVAGGDTVKQVAFFAPSLGSPDHSVSGGIVFLHRNAPSSALFGSFARRPWQTPQEACEHV